MFQYLPNLFAKQMELGLATSHIQRKAQVWIKSWHLFWWF